MANLPTELHVVSFSTEDEGEDFGFYFPNTPENRRKLEDIMDLFTSLDCAEYSLDGLWEAYTERDLDMLDRGADNGYMSRVNIVPNPETMLDLLLLIDEEEGLPYKGYFTVNGKEYRLKGD